MAEAKNGKQTGKLVALVVTAVLVGAVAGILLAPKSGKQTRDILRTKINTAMAVLNNQSGKPEPAAVSSKREHRTRKRQR